MELRRLHLSGCARQTDDVARLHRLAAPDVDAPGVTIGTHPAAAMVDQDQSAIDGDLIAGIGDDAVSRGMDRRAGRGGDIDPVRSEEYTSELQSLMRSSYAV